MSVQTLRPQQLGDYFIPMDVSRFNFDQRTQYTAPIVSQDKVLQNLDNVNKAASLRYLGDNVYYNSTFHPQSHDPSRVMNKNYAQNFPQTENFHTLPHPQKNQTFSKKSKMSRRNKHESRKILTTKHIETDSTENIGILSAELEREQEYQDQMNMIYNDPQYLEKYCHQLQYQPELHFNVDHQSSAPMFYLPLQQQPQFQEEKALQEKMETSSEVSSKDGFQVDAENSSDYYSDSANSSDTEEDDDVESVDDERSSLQEFNTNFITLDNSSTTENCLHHDDDSFLELDEELNNLVLSIITE